MSLLAERLRDYEIREPEFVGEANTEEVLDYLNRLTEKVESFEIGQVIVTTNLLQEGQRSPSMRGRLIRNIPTESGHLSVSNETWREAIERYLESLGVPIEFLFENLRRDAWGDERKINSPERPNLCLKIIRGYSPRSGDLESLRLEILRQPLYD